MTEKIPFHSHNGGRITSIMPQHVCRWAAVIKLTVANFVGPQMGLLCERKGAVCVSVNAACVGDGL